MSTESKKTIFSGMQPTGLPHIGNYYGAIKNWVKLHEKYNCLFCVVDLHSITVRQNPAELRKRCREVLMLYIASGLDPEENIIYYQSHVSAHSELSWILNCFTYMGELNRMTQFKDKSKKHADNLNAGLYTYPVLMAADILLYKTDLVPVGEDQRQHLEITRDIAARFNNVYGDVFTIPEPYIVNTGSKIMSLQSPETKMSKSDENPNGCINIMDQPNIIMSKIKKAVTDSGSDIIYSDEKPGIKNLLDIYISATGKTIDEAVKEFDGKGYGYFKNTVAEAVVSDLSAVQERFNELNKNKDYIDKIIKTNGDKANYLAAKTLRKVQKKVGFPVNL